NFALPRVLDDLPHLLLELFQVLVNDVEFADQLTLLKEQPSEPGWSFHPDTHRSQSLKLNKLRIGELTILPNSLQRAEACRRQSLGRGKCFAEGKCRLAIGIFQNAGQFRENLVAECGELVLALRTLYDEFFSVANHPAELSRSICRR